MKYFYTEKDTNTGKYDITIGGITYGTKLDTIQRLNHVINELSQNYYSKTFPITNVVKAMGKDENGKSFFETKMGAVCKYLGYMEKGGRWILREPTLKHVLLAQFYIRHFRETSKVKKEKNLKIITEEQTQINVETKSEVGYFIGEKMYNKFLTDNNDVVQLILKTMSKGHCMEMEMENDVV